MKTNAAAYIRVSTDDQTEYSPAAQLKAIQDYASRNDMIILPENIYKDEGISGKTAKKRPAFMQMVQTAKQYKGKTDKPFDAILVHKFDRFSRNREESIVYKSMLRKECGVKVISVTEHIEDDKFSVILEAMLEAMAEYYSLNLADEVKKGMTEKAHRGEYMTTAPIGYKWENGEFIIDENEAPYIKYIFESFVSGKSKSQITTALNDAGLKTHRGNPIELRTVDYILKNNVYAGYTRWAPEKQNYRLLDNCAITKKGKHQPIISEEIFEKAQEILKTTAIGKKVRTPSPDKYRYWLTGIMKCSNCGSSMSYTKSTKSMQCISYVHSVCRVSHSITINKVEKIITEELRTLLASDDLSAYKINKSPLCDTSSQQHILSQNITKIKSRLSRLKIAYLDGVISLPEYKQSKTEEEKELKTLEAELSTLEKKEFNAEAFKKNVRDSYAVITSKTATDYEKNIAVRKICEKIIYSKQNDHFELFYIF